MNRFCYVRTRWHSVTEPALHPISIIWKVSRIYLDKTRVIEGAAGDETLRLNSVIFSLALFFFLPILKSRNTVSKESTIPAGLTLWWSCPPVTQLPWLFCPAQEQNISSGKVLHSPTSPPVLEDDPCRIPPWTLPPQEVLKLNFKFLSPAALENIYRN